jgi:hypothetical protein
MGQEQVQQVDKTLRRGVAQPQALAEMLQRPERYERRLVLALQTLESQDTPTVLQALRVRDLCPGMVLEEDIRTLTGSLVLARGHEVSFALIERLRAYRQRVGIVEPFRVRRPVPRPE